MSEWEQSRISRDSYHRDLGHGLVLRVYYVDSKTGWTSHVWNMKLTRSDQNLQDAKDRCERAAIQFMTKALDDLQGKV